jgi:hypothetical protein
VSSALLVIALLVAIVNLVGPGALAAWGLGGGDGEPRNTGAGLLAVLVVAGLLATPAAAIRALTDDVPGWWWSLLPRPPSRQRPRGATPAQARALRRAGGRRAGAPGRRDRDRGHVTRPALPDRPVQPRYD